MNVFMRTENLSIDKSRELYNSLRNFVLNFEGHKYDSGSYLDEKNYPVSEEDKNKFTYERTEIKYKNINGDETIIRTYKAHHYLKWSKYGLQDNPSYQATIYAKRKSDYGCNSEYELWSVTFSDIPYMHYGLATSNEIPLDLIMPANMDEEKVNELMKIKEKKK